MSIRILHAADLHLDSAFEGLPPEKASERREGQYSVLEEIVAAAEKHCVCAILLCGDLFERPSVSPDTAARVSAILAGTSIPVFIAPGNHDYYSPRSPYSVAAWSENVHIFKSTFIERIELDGLTVYGAGFTDPNVYRPLLSGFHTTPQSITEGLQRSKPSVMALHGELNPPEPRYNPVSPADIAASGLDYLALGHVHQRSEPQKAGDTVYAFCGCPEGRGFDETGLKGAYLVQLGEEVEVSFLPLGGIRYSSLSVDLTGSADPAAAVLKSLPSGSQKEVFKITLEGEISPETLSLSDISSLISPYVYHAVFTDRTRLPKKIWDQAGEDTLTGLFLSILRDKLSIAGADEEMRLQTELAARYGIAALNGEEAPKL